LSARKLRIKFYVYLNKGTGNYMYEHACKLLPKTFPLPLFCHLLRVQSFFFLPTYKVSQMWERYKKREWIKLFCFMRPNK
jgi:hypothetical protein